MAGCFGSSFEDQYYERMLDEYLDESIYVHGEDVEYDDNEMELMEEYWEMLENTL